MLMSGTCWATRRDPADVAPEADHGQVDDGVDAVFLELTQTAHGGGMRLVLVPFRRRLLDLRAEHEHVLVHESGPEPVAVDRPPYGVDTVGMTSPSTPVGRTSLAAWISGRS